MQPPLPAADAHAIASFRKFFTLLPRSDDITLVILKLHLLVEEQIRHFVDERLPNKSALSKAKFECHQMICLAEAISGEDIHQNVWEAARKLNSLRNQIAHSLELNGVIDRMNSIATLIGLPPDNTSKKTKSPEQAAIHNLSFAVSLLHSEISLYVKRKPAKLISLLPGASEA